MPIRNLGPCKCCQKETAHPISFRILSIGGYFAGSAGPIGMHVEYEADGDVVFEVLYSDGSTVETSLNASSGGVVYDTLPSETTLSGTLEFDGYVGDWSLTFGWGTWGTASLYDSVDNLASWYAGGDDFRNETFEMEKI